MSETVFINVTGMKCGGCENTINNTLAAIDGVLSVNASHKDKQVEVEFEPEKTDLDAIEDAIINAGFTVE